MRINSKQNVGRTAGALSRSLPIKGFTKVLGGVIFAALLHSPIQALSANLSPGQSVTLVWNPSTNSSVAGYNVYYGGASGSYKNEIVAGSATNATISGLIPGSTYYFAATTYDSLGVESAFSSEVAYTVPASPAGLQFSFAPPGPFVLSVTGPAGQTYEIQATQDFETWTVISTVTVGAGGSVGFTDTNAGSFSWRFYRIGS